MTPNLAIYRMRLPGKIALTILVAVFFCMFIGLTRAGTAHADTNIPIDNNGPEINSGTITGTTTDFTPLTGVGQGNFNGQVMWYRVYVRNGLSATVTVTPTCNDRIGTPTVDYSMDILDPTEHDYGSGPFGGFFNNGTYTIEHDTQNCATPFNLKIPSNAGISSGILGHEGYRVFGFYAQIEALAPGTNQEQYFRVTSSSNTSGDSYVGLAKPDLTNPSLGGKKLLYSTVYRTSGTWNTEVMFAPECFEDVSGTKTIQIFDPDNGIYQNNMHADLLTSSGIPPPWNTVKTWDAQTVQGGAWGTSNTTGFLNYGNYKNGNVYKLEIIGSSHPNTVQIKLPFDQFDSKVTVQNYCDVSCKAIAPQNGATIPVNQDTNVSIRGIGNKGPVTWVPDDADGGYYIKRIGSNDVNATGGVSEPNYVSLTGSNPYTDTVHPPPGTTQAIYTYEIYSREKPLTSPFGTGITCKVTYNVAPVVIVTCTVGAQADVSPGQPINNLYTVNVKATGTGLGGNFSVQMSASPGAYISGPNPNPQTVTIPNNPGNFSKTIYFSGHLDYGGSFTVTITPPSGNPATSCSGNGAPVVAPYFQVWQNDAAAGGGFKNGDMCSSTYPAYVSPATANAGANSQYYGGIRANSSTYKSKTDFGAVALGLIPTLPGEFEGFSARNNAYFANPAGTLGYFNHTAASSNHCATDFYNTTMIDTPANTNKESDLNQAIQNCQPDPVTNERRCQYIWTGGDIPTGTITIPAGVQMTIYASTDIKISANIVYGEPFDPTVIADIPYFALIDQGGDITLSDSATELDGLYVTQPTISGSTVTGGTFATCDSQCPNQLIVNGAVIAQHIKLLRAHGTSEDLGGSAVNTIGNAPAEIFNFVPSMILGAPAFSPQCPTCTEGQFSLPPVF